MVADESLRMKGATAAYSGVPATGLARLLDGILSGDACWGLVQRLDRIAWLRGQAGYALLYFAANSDQTRLARPLTPDALVQAYPAGRVFDEKREWRWLADGAATFAPPGQNRVACTR